MSSMNRKRGVTTVPLMAALLCSAAFVATAATAAPKPADSIHVKYVAADLTQPEAAQALYRHIQRAARQVCHEPEMRDLSRFPEYQRCYERAVDDAVANVGASALTALHRVKTQHSTSG